MSKEFIVAKDMIIGRQVKHRLFGMGTIIEFDAGMIVVDFSGERKTFQFPAAFKSFLKTEDDDLQSVVKNAFETEEAARKKADEERMTLEEERTATAATPVKPRVMVDPLYTGTKSVMIYFEPVNLKQWNMFEKVSGIGHVEPFLATQSMEYGDRVLLHVGQQDKRYESGIYAYGTVIKGPFVLRGHPDDYCNYKNTVMIRFDRISYTSPLITHDACTEFIRQFRTVHRIDPEYYDMIDNLLHIR